MLVGFSRDFGLIVGDLGFFLGVWWGLDLRVGCFRGLVKLADNSGGLPRTIDVLAARDGAFLFLSVFDRRVVGVSI